MILAAGSAVSFIGCLALWILIVVFVVLPLLKSAQHADEELERMEDDRRARDRAVRRIQGQ